MLSRVITSSHNPPWNWKLLNGHIGLGWSLYLTAASAEHFLSNTVCSGQDTTFAKELMGKRCTPSYYGTHARLARLHRTLGQAETYLLENCQRRCRKTRHLLIHLSSCLGEKMWVMDGARKKEDARDFPVSSHHLRKKWTARCFFWNIPRNVAIDQSAFDVGNFKGLLEFNHRFRVLGTSIRWRPAA